MTPSGRRFGRFHGRPLARSANLAARALYADPGFVSQGAAADALELRWARA